MTFNDAQFISPEILDGDLLVKNFVIAAKKNVNIVELILLNPVFKKKNNKKIF